MALIEILEVLPDNLLQRRRRGQTQGNCSRAIHCDRPVVDNALNALIRRVDDQAEVNLLFSGNFAQNLFRQTGGDSLSRQSNRSVTSQAFSRHFMQGDQ